MLTLIVFVIIGLLLANRHARAYMRRTPGARYIDYPDLQICFVLYFTGAIFLAMALGVFVLCQMVPRVQFVESERTLVALRAHNDTQGTMVWGSGTIGGVLVYNVYVKTGDSAYVPMQVDSRRVMIVEDSSLQASGVWRHVVSVRDRRSLLAPWSLFKEDKQVVLDELRVPVGTVVQQFNIK